MGRHIPEKMQRAPIKKMRRFYIKIERKGG
jgi:hypothetical protein